MRTGLLISLLLLLLVACKSKNAVPGNIIPQKKMQAMLWDMMRADQFLSDYVLNRDSSLKKETESIKYYRKIFAIHGVSKEEFQRSFAFYRSEPALLKIIMDSISAPPNSATVPTEQVNVPLAVPDSAVQVAPGIRPDTTPRVPPGMRRGIKADSLRMRKQLPVVAY